MVGLYTARDAGLRIRKRHRGTAVSCLYALYGGTDSDYEDYFEALIECDFECLFERSSECRLERGLEHRGADRCRARTHARWRRKAR